MKPTSPDLTIVTMTQGTVTHLGGQKVGVMRIEEDEYVLPGGARHHGVTARLALFPPERELSVGPGSVLEVDGARYEVTQVTSPSSTGQVMLRRLP